jgi:hypothetical protein
MVARALAERCRGLRRDGWGAAEAERLTFEEFLRQTAALGSVQPNLYEDFLAAYAPEQRRARGVYYTPAPLVAAQVRLAADLLEQRLGCRTAFGDHRVTVVDPATGSGAYPLAVLADTLERAPEAARTLPQRMRLFEPLAGAASLARAHGLDVEECDVLASQISLDVPIVVCLGNPPYQRRQRQAAPDHLLDDVRVPAAGVHLKNAYNDYVYFWCWALRAVFEQRRGPGILSFVSASSYLNGPGFVGLRRMLRRVVDELWIVDLEGDHLAARQTDNVFPIRTPVAVAMAVRYAESSSNEQPAVHYARLAGRRETKLAALNTLRHISDLTWQPVAVDPDWCAPLVPRCRSAYQSWPKLTELFPWQLSGAQIKRTWPIGPTPEVLRERWEHLLSLGDHERSAAFKPTRDRDLDSTPPDLHDRARHLEPLRSLALGTACLAPVPYAYRSFDRQWVLPDARLGDFMRPELWRVAGPRQVFLTSLLTNVLGSGPAAVATAFVPDLDHFRGSFGGRAVIPLWRDAEATLPNVAGPWLERLTARYGAGVDPETLLAYCYALLGTRSYVSRFEQELRSPGPRMPFPREAALFRRAAELGRRLLWLHTFGARYASPGELAAGVPTGSTRCLEPPGPGCPAELTYDPLRQRLQVGGGSFGPLAPAVWEYSVSGLRVVPSWLRRRLSNTTRGTSPLDGIGPRAWTPSLTRELLELSWVLEATLALEPSLDAVLDEIVSDGGETWALRRAEQAD